MWRLRELLFELVGQQIDGVGCTGAWPAGTDNHRLNGEGWIFVARELLIAEDATDDCGKHQEDDKRLMVERPFRQIETGTRLG